MAASAWRSHLDRLSAGPGAPPSGGSPFEVEASDGTVLRGEDFGSKQAPPIVLIHGWSGSAAYWRLNIVELVGKGLRVIVYDHRGHGDRCCLLQPLRCCVCAMLIFSRTSPCSQRQAGAWKSCLTACCRPARCSQFTRCSGRHALRCKHVRDPLASLRSAAN